MEFSACRNLGIFVILGFFLAGLEAASAPLNTVSPAQNCSATKGAFSCYTCMGRDMQNCNWGTTCCKGACYKLEDVAHNLIIKGCVPTREEDASMKVRTLETKLYWTQNEKVKGESFFCNQGDYCNSASTVISMISMLLPFSIFLL
ncbi:unnamed protein product [Caenorhabditis angaria]|uniref:UPAR/Ly6 domain-containing protein n=1 Tax=Caenorhabditis angaria TaxID=860376 RepID=A0A9P1ISI5_9PELO|nr:unnamed protein product [Caenorhabditis angaria]